MSDHAAITEEITCDLTLAVYWRIQETRYHKYEREEREASHLPAKPDDFAVCLAMVRELEFSLQE